MGICMRYEKNREDAEAVLNHAFLKILKNLNTYKEKVPFEAWIRKITIHTVIDHYRSKQKEKIDYVESMDEHKSSTQVDYNEVEKVFQAEDLEAMVRQLPSVSQKVFNLYAIDGYSHREISQMLRISDGTSKWHLSEARKRLKELLKQAMGTSADLNYERSGTR